MTPFLQKMKWERRIELLSTLFLGIAAFLTVVLAIMALIFVFTKASAAEQYWCFERGVCP